MRTSIAFLFLLNSLTSFSQTKKDTLDHLFHLSEQYFIKMYVEKDFDSASIMWDKSSFENLINFYSTKNSKELSDSSIFVKIRSAYEKYFKTISNFRFAMFGYHVVADNWKRKIVQLSFHYKETDDKKSKKKSTALLFVTYDSGKTWKIQDAQAVEIFSNYLY